ncbi:MAG: hypothetical protein ACUVRA_07455 [Candidatus Bathyarchaeaceae archaeon]
MRLTRNVKAISKLIFILSLLATLIIGAVLSYLWVMGYYVTLNLVYPEDVTVNITDYAFDNQNTSYFNVTIQCPTSYKSKDPANITRITVSTEDGILHDMNGTEPILPYKFQHKGDSQTFKCLWNWANYTGQTIKIIAFVAVGSGPTFEARTPLVDLRIIDVRFNSTISITYFNMTVQNSPSSVTYVNITEVSIDREPIPPENLSISLPHALNPDESVPLKCMWNWTAYQNKSVTIAVHTLQGYVSNTTVMTPLPVTLEITKVDFNLANATRFKITVRNNDVSPTYLNLTKISVTMDQQTVREWTVENGTQVDPHLPYTLDKNFSETFVCPWNWTEHRDKNVTVTVYSLQGFTARYSRTTPAPIILEVVKVSFDPLNTASFNVTVKNSEFSTANANITEIRVTVNGISRNMTDVVPSLEGGIILSPKTNQTFTCFWNWSLYSGKNATIVVQTQEGYSASYSVLLKALTITDALFNPIDMGHFVATVQNPTWLNFTITAMNVTVDGISENITDYVVPSLPLTLPNGTNILFMCTWNWADYQGWNVTITIETLEGYTTSYMCKIP